MPAKKYQHDVIRGMKIRLRLKETLEENQIEGIKTLKDLAKKLDVDERTVSNWNNGAFYPRLDMFFLICIILKADPLEIVDISDREI